MTILRRGFPRARFSDPRSQIFVSLAGVDEEIELPRHGFEIPLSLFVDSVSEMATLPVSSTTRNGCAGLYHAVLPDHFPDEGSAVLFRLVRQACRVQ